MPITGTQQVTAQIAPSSLSDTYATHDELFGKGGWRTVATTTVRDNIPAARRSVGMIAYCLADGKTYQLAANLTTWNEYSVAAILPTDVMLKSVYDPNDDGVVVDSDKLQSQNGAYYLSRANHTGTQAQSTITNLVSDLAAKLNASAVGVSVAQLVAGVVPVGQLPFSSTAYLGVYNANTNTPTLTNGVGTAGQWVWTTVAGSAGPQGATSLNTAVVYNGTIWQVGPTVTGSIISVNGQTGAAVVLDLDDIADTLTRAAVSPDEAAGIAASTYPITAANPAVSKQEITNLIVVGNGVFMAELFSNGHTLGDGTLRMLSTLTNPATGVAYTNLSAGNYWTRVNSAYTINVNTMSIDWIARQEAYLAMEQDGYSKIISPGGRGYCPSQTWDLPRDQEAVSLYRRGYKFIFDDQGSVTYNRTGNNIILYKRMPTDQTEAQGVFLDYGYFFQNMFLYGNQTSNANNLGIQLGATTHSRFDNIETNSFNQAVDIQFALELSMKNIKHVNYYTHGTKIGKGTWSGATSATAGVNEVDIVQHRCYNGSGRTPVAGLYFYGCPGNVEADTLTFEGFNGAQQHIFYDNDASDGVAGAESALSLSNLYFETAGASRAAIRFKSAKGDFFVNKWSNIVSLANMPVLIEAEQPSGLGGVRQLYVNVAGYATGQITPKFRATCPYSRVANGSIFESGYCSYFDVSRVNMPNGTGAFNTATNFDTSLPNYVVPMGNQFTYLPSPI